MLMLSSITVLADAGDTVYSLQKFIDARLAAGEKQITIPSGRYEVKPQDGVHLRLRGLHDVTIDAKGVEMVCTETTLAIHVQNCVNLRINGLTIDYDPLPFTQGRIVEISEDRNSHIIEIMDGFPPAEAAYVFKHSIYTADAELRFGNYYQYQLEVLEDGRLKVFGLNPRVDGGEQVGDIAVVSSRHLSGRYMPHAIVVDNSVGTVFEEVRIYSSPCFGFFEQNSSGSIYLNCVIDRRDGRVHSLNADGFHSKYAEVGPQIIGCTAMWQGDDGVNICGDYYFVTGGEDDWVRILAGARLSIRQGDVLQLVNVNGQRLEDSVAVAIERIGPMDESDAAAISSARLDRGKAGRMNQAYILRLDREVALDPGAIVASENRMGNGFAVKNSTFGNLRSRGILIKASNGEISGNKLINTQMEAIKIAPEYYWLESGFSRNLKVSNNQIINPGREAIQVRGIGQFPGHKNIDVLENVIQTDVQPAILMQSVEQGRIHGNKITDTAGSPVSDGIKVRFSESVDIK